MKNVFSLRKRSFLSPVSTGFTSHIFAEVESSNGGEYRWGHNMLTIADCRRRVQMRIPADRGHQFRRIVGSDSGPSWAPIPVHRGQLQDFDAGAIPLAADIMASTNFTGGNRHRCQPRGSLCIWSRKSCD